MKKRGVIVIDLGSQTTNLIARRVRSLGVLAEVVNSEITASEVASCNPYCLILSGGPMSTTDADHPDIDPEIFNLGIPILGICFGMYLVAIRLGAVVEDMETKEYGATKITLKDSRLFSNLPASITVWMNHGSEIKSLGEILPSQVTASSQTCFCSSIENHEKKLYGLQFHPEVAHTEHGLQILSNFVLEISGAAKNWSLNNWLEEKFLEVKRVIGDQKAICALSGGVDSTTAAVLCSRSMGAKLHCIFIDTGLMRLNEALEIQNNLAPYNLNLHIIDAKERFFSRLKGVIDPEEKRKIIGREYIRIFEEEASKIKEVNYLIQGTIYSDKIESSKSSKHASNIKSHHNVGGLPDDIAIKIYEPLEDLFKDEVRQIGKALGLAENIYNRHPFPGPGLAIQIIGEVTQEAVDIVQAADAIVIEEVKKAGLYSAVGEIFTNFTGIKTTGVKGDARVYEWLVAIRSVDPSDLMTSSWSQLPYALMATMSNRITNEVKGVNRVVYDITTKPPATIRWE